MRVECGWCDRVIEVPFMPFANDHYICKTCQSGYEAARFRDLVRRRIEKIETIDPCPICGSNEGELEDSGLHKNCQDDEY